MGVLADEEKTVVKVNIWDTAGQEEFENLRTLTYPDTDLFIVCFSMVERSSFDNVKHLWLKDLNGRAAKTPKFLVGTKKDLSAKEDINSVSQAFELATLRALKGVPEGENCLDG